MPGHFMLLNNILFFLLEFHTVHFEYITPHNSLHNYPPIFSHPTLRFLLLIVPGSGACLCTWLTYQWSRKWRNWPFLCPEAIKCQHLLSSWWDLMPIFYAPCWVSFGWNLSKSCMCCLSEVCCILSSTVTCITWAVFIPAFPLLLLSHSVFKMFFSNNTYQWHTPCLRF